MIKIARLRSVDKSSHKDIAKLLGQLSAGKTRVSPSGLKKFIARKNIELWVARDGEKIVGMATLIEFPMLSGASGDVEDVVVDEGYRGHGIGTSLMKKLIERARARGCVNMDLTSRPSRVAANALYQKLGFELRETNVYRIDL